MIIEMSLENGAPCTKRVHTKRFEKKTECKKKMIELIERFE